ncbi:MAG: signal peptidase I [Micavibrio sp.]|nr:signal peptidase I [Micavibrio sp.]|tara:strand:- start:1599 stop:2453 length:855 start_codon:yes stop_codon:yes gene_type:complete
MSDKPDSLEDECDIKAAKQPPLTAKEEVSEFAKTILIAVALAMLIRTFMYEPFNIPSGSMKPTLLIGDYLFVNKPAYGYSRYSFPFGLAPLEGRVWDKPPKQGDVAVFKLPSNTYIDYIKRVIGLPGDTIQMRRGRLYINGNLVPRESLGMKKVWDQYRGEVVMEEFLETLPNGTVHHILEESDDRPLDNTEVFTVPEGHYFMMGDNRDNSVDSRAPNGVGFVPAVNLVGEADFIFYSTNGYAKIYEVWKWPWTIRFNRIFDTIKPVRPADQQSDQAVDAGGPQ